MMSTHAGGQAGPVRFLVTDGGAHPAAKWAEETTLQLVAIGDGLPPARLEAAIALRRRIQRILVDVFELVKATTTGNQILALTEMAMSAILDEARGTDWYGSFTHPDLSGVMHLVIRRNLATAANIAIDWS